MDFNDDMNKALKYGVEHGHSDFHRKIMENRQEMMPALAYADWLEENGMPTHAEVIRRHVKAYSNAVDPGGMWDVPDHDRQAFASSGTPTHYVRLSMRSPSGDGMLNWWAVLPSGGAGAVEKHRLMRQLAQEGAAVSGDYRPDDVE